MKKKEFIRKQKEEMKELKKIMYQLYQTTIPKAGDGKASYLIQSEDRTNLSTEDILDRLQEEAAEMEFSGKKEEISWLKQYHALEKKILNLSAAYKVLKKENAELRLRSKKHQKALVEVNDKVDKLSKMYAYLLYMSGVYNHVPDMSLNEQYKKLEKKVHKKQEYQCNRNYGKCIDVPYKEVSYDGNKR